MSFPCSLLGLCELFSLFVGVTFLILCYITISLFTNSQSLFHWRLMLFLY